MHFPYRARRGAFVDVLGDRSCLTALARGTVGAGRGRFNGQTGDDVRIPLAAAVRPDGQLSLHLPADLDGPRRAAGVDGMALPPDRRPGVAAVLFLLGARLRPRV